jgi:hypothetical protein
MGVERMKKDEEVRGEERRKRRKEREERRESENANKMQQCITAFRI